MVDVPRPEHYPSFPQWLEATRKAFKVRKQDLAQIAGVTPQAVTKWFRGGDVGPDPLRKLSDWSGVPYAELRMLLEGQPVTAVKPKKGLAPPSPVVQRLSRKLQILSSDESSLGAVEALVDTFLSQQAARQKVQRVE
jgi:transcriptional regulator with XRE-family HTH domain